jgi:hypothetical protein
MQAQSKHYIDGFLNADNEANSVFPNQCINAENLRFGTTDKGNTGRWENVGSTLAIENPYLPEGTNITIGSKEDEEGRYLIQFNYNSNNDHAIYLYYKPTDTFYQVLTGSILNFNKYQLVQCTIINNILYWTDGLNEPCRINLAAAIKMNHSGSSPITSTWQYTSIADAYDYTIIRRPSQLTGTILKDTDDTFENNFIQNESFRFAYQFIYYDGEQSVLSIWTTSSKLNTATEEYNKITVTANPSESIPESVRIVRLIAIEGGDVAEAISLVYVIKTWDRERGDTEIDDHNAGNTPLTYEFYNDIRGEVIDAATYNTPFHSVPLIAKTIESARDRVFLANTEAGYASPSETSLQLSSEAINFAAGTSFVTNLIEFRAYIGVPGDDNNYRYGAYYVRLTDGRYYLINGSAKTSLGFSINWTSNPALDSQPSTLAQSALTDKGANPDEVFAQIMVDHGGDEVRLKAVFTRSTVITITGTTVTTYSIFKSRSNYKGGVVFYDKAMRKCGVVTNENVFINTPQRDFAFTSGVNSIGWALSNTSSLTEIPDWAYFYAPVLTKNLRTRFFVQGFDKAAKYATKDANSAYVFSGTSFASGVVAIAIEETALVQANLGYSFTEGDMCILVGDDNNVHDLPILGIEGKYILLSPKDIGNLSSKKFVYELYTPYQSSEQEPFYEMGQVYQVTNPATSSREYSQLSGSFGPDSFAFTRNFDTDTYFSEAMCPNDKFYKRWDTDHGRINIETSEGRKAHPVRIQYSGTYVAGTFTNNLSNFEALNYQDLPLELGSIKKLILTSKAQQEGTVMLSIGVNETASIYLGEAQLADASGNNIGFSKTQGVIGSINVLKGNYGTLHPESVVSFRGNVFWLDALSSCFVEYSLNGLDDISFGEDGVFKFGRFSKNFCEKLLTTNTATIEGFGSRPFVFGGVDPYHKEILWSIPKLDTVPNGELSDYSDVEEDYIDTADYPYDILDFKAKTLVFKVGPQRWMGSYSFPAEYFASIDTSLYSFKDGVLYKHNETTSYNNFYDATYRSKLAIVCNQDNVIKEFTNISIEASEAPEWLHIRSEYPFEQSSDLIDTDFADKEGIFYASFLRDRLSPAVTGTASHKQMVGDRVRTQALLVLLQFNNSSQIYFRTATIGYNISTGQL